MGNDEKSISGIPISGALAVFAFILGLLVIPQAPFKASRPTPPEEIRSALHEGEDVQARLWQDPFSAVMTHRRDMGSDLNGHNVTDLAKQIINKGQNEIVVLGVMVNGGPYAENVESRIRFRYAVLSALGEIDKLTYVPEDSEHMGYLEFNLNSHKQWFMDLVPYEWFESEEHESQRVLVLWLNDNRFSDSPLRKLSNFIGLLKDTVKGTSRETGGNTPKLTCRILGPASSTNLKGMIREKKLDWEHRKNLENVQIFSWAATLDPEKKDPVKTNIEKKCMIYLGESLKFFRTIGPDRILTDLLVEELGLRIEGMVPEEKDLPNECAKKPYPEERKVRIVLISEWDTVYGRSLPDSFIKSVAKKNGLEPEDIDWIYKFSYMRGIDGQIPDKKKMKKDTTGASKKNDTATEKQDIERPVGPSQFDYLRRLASRLQRLDEEIKDNGKSRIQAIGVLGSDVYDKLLVLQAMHKVFPNVIFFTTDLDARLLHPDELSWTQNLVIASNFGLRLNKKFQKNVPPFRDNYQTSLFFSTKIAMGDCEMPLFEGNKCLGTPRIFEVGRSDAFALRAKNDKPEETRSIHPLLNGYGQTWMDPLFSWLCFGATLLFTILFIRFYYPYWKKENVKGIEASKKYQLSPCFLVLFLILLVAVLTLIISRPGQNEPFAFFEGISIWPTEFLRFMAGGIAIYFIITGFIKVRLSDKQLSDQFFNPQSDHPEEGKVRKTAKGKTDRLKTPLSVWDDYQKNTVWKRRGSRILPLGAIYYGMCACIIFMFGEPFVPYRGDVSFRVDKIAILVFSIPSFIFLLFWIVDFTIMSGHLIRNISQLDAVWPKEATRHISKTFNMDDAYLNEWIDIQVIVKISETAGRFVYYPFIVILILGASRLRYFDRWDMPLGLLIVIMLGLAYSVYCAVSLRNAARKAREIILNKLWERQLNLKALKKDAISEQIKMMYDAIKSLRKGAFVPFFEQPFVRAVTLFLSGAGSLVALNYL